MKKFMMMVAMAFATLTASAQAEAGTLTLKPLVGINVANITEVVVMQRLVLQPVQSLAISLTSLSPLPLVLSTLCRVQSLKE